MNKPEQKNAGTGHKAWSLGRQETVLGVVLEAAEAAPDKVFLNFAGDPYTYAEAIREVSWIAAALKDRGVQPGDVVASMLDTSPEAVWTWFAANAIGAIHYPMNTALKGEFLRHVLHESGATVLVAEPDFVARIVPLKPDLPMLKHLLLNGDAEIVGGVDGLLSSYRDLSARLPATVFRSPSDVTCLVGTGGTTGPSKLCMIPENQMCDTSRRGLDNSGRAPDEIVWNCLPGFHVNQLLTIVGSAMFQSTGYLAKRFSLSGFWPEIESSGARVVNVLGSMVSLIARMPDTPEMLRCHGQIRLAIGVPFPPELQEIWRTRFGTEFAGGNAYGMTEAVGVTSAPISSSPPPGSAGRRNAHFDVRVIAGSGDEAEPGDVGEIVLRPNRPNIMFAGYWNNPEATMRASKDYWFHTGDFGRFDENGWLYFVDRSSDYIRRRGENISSSEVERTMLTHPAIQEIAVHAVPSELTEDDVKFTVVGVSSTELSAEELFAWSVERLPYFALPRYIEFRDALPKSPLNKVLNTKLREEGVTAETWDREVAGVTFERR
ncbi:MAG: AMP-binding protein [Vicinamibacterales bacterium]|nr:AMP-binding protein [Vicinamibacterales bacterium]